MDTKVTLSSLSIKATVGGMSDIESFDPEKTVYKADVQGDIDKISLMPVADKNCSVTINSNEVAIGEEYLCDLAAGENKFDIVVTKAEYSKDYTVYITKENIQPVIDKFQRTKFADPKTGVTLNYNLFVPDDYDGSKSYPLVLFLHGAGERGDDSLSILTANQGATVWAKETEQAKRPCIVLAPQCPAERGWTSLMLTRDDPFRPLDELETVYDLIHIITRKYNIDKKRLYCTGLSMGGFGSWALNIKYPDLFAAVAPICSYGDTKEVKKIAKKPIWVMTAEEDPLVNVQLVRDTVDALKAAGGNPIYTEFPAGTYFYPMAHFSWVPAYANEKFREWLFSQKLSD